MSYHQLKQKTISTLKSAGRRVSSPKASSKQARRIQIVMAIFLFVCAVSPVREVFAFNQFTSFEVQNNQLDFASPLVTGSNSYGPAFLELGNSACDGASVYSYLSTSTFPQQLSTSTFVGVPQSICVLSGLPGDSSSFIGQDIYFDGSNFQDISYGTDQDVYFTAFAPSGIVATSSVATTSVSLFIGSTLYQPGTTVTVQFAPSNVAYCNLGAPSAIEIAPPQLLGNGVCTGSQVSNVFSNTWQVSTSGASTYYATTSLLYIGTYDVTMSINSPGLFGTGIFSSSLVSSSTQFLVSTTSPFDKLQTAVVGAISSFETSTSTIVVDSVCNPLSGSFSVVPCMTALVIPSSIDLNNVYNAAFGQVLNNTPFSLIQVFLGIFSSSTPVEPPPLSYTFGSSSPAVLQGQTYTINIFDPQYIGSSSPLDEIEADDGTGKNIWQIVDPYFTDIVAIAVFLAILSDILGLEIHHDRTQETTTTMTPEVRTGGRPTGITHFTTTKSGFRKRTRFGNKK